MAGGAGGEAPGADVLVRHRAWGEGGALPSPAEQPDGPGAQPAVTPTVNVSGGEKQLLVALVSDRVAVIGAGDEVVCARRDRRDDHAEGGRRVRRAAGDEGGSALVAPSATSPSPLAASRERKYRVVVGPADAEPRFLVVWTIDSVPPTRTCVGRASTAVTARSAQPSPALPNQTERFSDTVLPALDFTVKAVPRNEFGQPA